jgi:heme/copper-type cytochrome/quinol oxidase subunit 3
MTARVVDVSELPEGTIDSRALIWWGNLGMMVIEGTMFALVIASYLYLRTVNIDWPPATVQPPVLFWPTLDLAILLISVAPVLWVDRAAKREERLPVLIGLPAAVIAGLVVLFCRYRILTNLGYKWSDHAYGSMIWVIFGLHLLHVIAATCECGLVAFYCAVWPITKKKYLDVRCTAVYWYFVVITWLPFYVIVFIVPWMQRKGPAL